MRVEIIKAGKLRLGHHEVAPGVSHHPLDFAFVIPLAGTAKAILKQIMRHQFREYTGPFACPIPENAGNCDPRIVIKDRHRHTAEERERRDMRITECFRRLSRIRLQKTCIRMWQVHHQKVDLLFDTANHGECLAKIRLSMARRMRQWHEHLPLTLLGREDIVLHNPDRVKTLGGGGFRPAHGDVRVRHETHSWH